MRLLMIPARRATSLKKTAFVLAICALTLFILLPAVSPVNTLTSGTSLTDNVQYTHSNTETFVADGGPIPPPIPPSFGTSILLADGGPIPPPIPPSLSTSILLADGGPIPPPIPPSLTSILVADGGPIPPPIPPSPGELFVFV